MSEDFQILVHNNEGNLHLKLMGDFDEDSAREVLKAVRDKSHATSRVFIHTNGLHQIYPKAQKVFQENIDSMELQSIPVLFTGEKADQLAPNENILR
ncbi:MAG: hypothetical protein JRJ77_12495 [Deltaproteobacteria bacterium]|nr:hypothetical protein [Deltaproteobacteria bacterium]MBW2341641.1 hypothetical protein [Deltaproteobacteria bacterium]